MYYAAPGSGCFEQLRCCWDCGSPAPGDTIVWITHDIIPHTATAGDKTWDSQSIGKESQWETVVQPGMAEDYFCRFHPNMKARLQIAAGAAETN